jgi:RHS repeat-associated protein
MTVSMTQSAPCLIGRESEYSHFTGKERDTESGLDYFGARYYASSMGRFLTPDFNGDPEPVSYADLGDPQTLNLYSYVQNNPLTKRDFDGHASWQNCSDGSGSQCWTGDYNGEYNNGLFWNAQSSQWQQNHPNPQPDSPAGEFFTGLTRSMVANTGSDFGYGVRQMASGLSKDFLTLGAKSALALIPPVKFLHSKDLLKQNSNIDSVRKMSTQQIIDSLKPGQPDSLKAKADGTIMDGNTRLRVLEERGVDINSLPRELYSSEPAAPWEEPGGGEGPIIP